jgi:hypothetical protein
MSKKSAAHLKKVNEAVRILGTTICVNIPQAMILAGFPKKDTTNETVRRMICCHLEAHEGKKRKPWWGRRATAAARYITINLK